MEKEEKFTLKFYGYNVEEIKFNKNEDFISKSEKILLKPVFVKDISINDEMKRVVVSLTMEITDSVDNPTPFNIFVKLSGLFEYNKKDDTIINMNTIAILYPYLRSIVSNITMTANITPYILPIVNVSDMFKEKSVK